MRALPMTPSRKISSTVLSARPSRQGSSTAARAQGMTTAAIQATTRRGRGCVCVWARAKRVRAARTQTQTQPRPRRVVAWIAAVVIPCALAAVLLPWRDGLALSTVLLIFLLGVIGNALI